MGKKAALHNLGCKVNAYELEAMQQLLEKNGYEIVPFEPGADLYLINTCTVTNIADRKSRQMLHRAKKMNPHAVVAAVGCYDQARGKELEKDEAIDLVIGNKRKKDLIMILKEYEAGLGKHLHRAEIGKASEYEELEIDRTEEHTRAFIKMCIRDSANTGFIGIPLISAVLGTQALIYVTVFNIAFTLLFYTHGTRILLSDGERQKVTWKTFINIGTVSGLLALVFFWFRLRFPAVIEGSITTMRKATTFLSMTVLGVSLAQIPLRKIFSSVRLLLFVLARMLALPAVFCLILKQFLGGGLMINAVALMLAMPSANMPLMVAKQHGLETETLSRGIVLSTILSIVTITVISMII